MAINITSGCSETYNVMVVCKGRKWILYEVFIFFCIPVHTLSSLQMKYVSMILGM